MAALGAALALASPAAAQQASGGGASGDQTRTAYLAGADRAFDRLDTNKDGVVDAAEQTAAIDAAVRRLRARMERSFRYADPTHSGQVTREAYRDDRGRLFDRMDADKDGVVTVAERRAFYDRSARKRRARSD